MSNKTIDVCLNQDGPIPLDVKFACAKGKILVVLGPSGSGKTTILRSIAGLYTPQAGKISADGINWFDSDLGQNLAVQKRQVGMVFQSYALFPHLSALNNITVSLSHQEKERQIKAELAALSAQADSIRQELENALEPGSTEYQAQLRKWFETRAQYKANGEYQQEAFAAET